MKTLHRYLAGTKRMVLTLRPKINLHPKQTTLDIDTYMWVPIGQVGLFQEEALPEWLCTFSAL